MQKEVWHKEDTAKAYIHISVQVTQQWKSKIEPKIRSEKSKKIKMTEEKIASRSSSKKRNPLPANPRPNKWKQKEQMKDDEGRFFI